jgi:hypothetical protein
MAANKLIRFGPVALSNTLTTNIVNTNVTSLAGPVGVTVTQPYVIWRHIRIVEQDGHRRRRSRSGIGATGANAAGTEVIGTGDVGGREQLRSIGTAMLRMDAADFLVGGAGLGGHVADHRRRRRDRPRLTS